MSLKLFQGESPTALQIELASHSNVFPLPNFRGPLQVSVVNTQREREHLNLVAVDPSAKSVFACCGCSGKPFPQTFFFKKKLDHGWPESRTSQARSAQRCRMRSFSLHFVKQARDSTRQGALRKLVGASWSAQVALRKLHCASCSAQVAPRKLLRQVGPCKLLCANCAPCKLLCASCSVQVALRKLLCVSCSAQVALGKALCANWSVQVGLRKLLCATCSAQVALRKLL